MTSTIALFIAAVIGWFGISFGLSALQYWLSNNPTWKQFSECGIFTTEYQVVGVLAAWCVGSVVETVRVIGTGASLNPDAIGLLKFAIVGLSVLGGSYCVGAGLRKQGLAAKVTEPPK